MTHSLDIAAIRARLQRRTRLWHGRAGSGMMARAIEEADGDIAALLGEVERLQEALIALIWGCANGAYHPYPSFEDARRILGAADPLRHVPGYGPVDEEEALNV